MKFSEKQLKAIEIKDENVLVSAAAGSGKTAVLVARIEDIITNGDEDIHSDIDELLVLTFTNFAAHEMKTRLANKILERLNEASKDDLAYSTLLRRQLDKLPNSQISTFHSFAQKVIKEHFYKIDLSPNSRLIDENRSEVMKHKALDKVFEFYFKDSEIEFLNLLRAFASPNNENRVKQDILALYSKIMALPNPFKRLEEYIEYIENGYFKDEIKEYFIHKAKFYLEHTSSKLQQIIEKINLLSDNQCVNTVKKIAENLEIFSNIYSFIEQKEIQKGISCYLDENNKEIGIKSIGAGSGEQEIYKSIKDDLEDIKKEYNKSKSNLKNLFVSMKDEEKVYADVMDSLWILKIYVKLVKSFHKEYTILKRSKNVIDFSDLEHGAIKILDNPDIANLYRNKFKYIFIDEYQDTNDIQDYIINKIKRKNNLFMVGDVKQSIYRFRMAEPEIFESKYKLYTDYTQKDLHEDIKGIKIDLNENYRTEKEVISYINDIFEPIINNYNEDNQLNYPFKDTDVYIDENQLNLIKNEELLIPKTEFILVENIKDTKDKQGGEAKSEEDLYDELENVGVKKEHLDIELWEMNRAHTEAMAVAKIIKENIGKKYLSVRKNENGETEDKIIDISYKNIYLLLRGKTEMDVFKTVLEKNGIPVFVENKEGYFDRIEVKTILNILSLINNSSQDLAVLAFLTSPVVNMKPDELAKIRINSKSEKFYVSAKKYIRDYKDSSTDAEKKIVNKLIFAKEKIKIWRRELSKRDIEDFLWYLIEDSGIYDYVMTLSYGNQRQLNLRTLVDKVREYKEFDRVSLKGFLSYINNLKKKGIKVGETNSLSENDDVVQIMTIHKSKGGEKEIVIVAGGSKNLEKEGGGFKPKFEFNKHIGIGLPLVNFNEKTINTTMLQEAIKNKNKISQWIEEVYIYYVALTRAKRCLYIVGTGSNYSELHNKSYLGLAFNSISNKREGLEDVFKKISLMDLVEYIPIISGMENKRENVYNFLDNLKKEYNCFIDENIENLKVVEDISKNINKLKLKSKYSVTEFKDLEFMRELESSSKVNDNERKLKIEIKTDYAQDMNIFLKDKKLSPSQLGTVYHKILELVDFKVYSQNKEILKDIIKKVDKIYEPYFSKVSDEINIESIESFLHSELGMRIARNNHRKEVGFKLLEEVCGQEVIVQGIIDCFFEEDGKYVIVDYKSNRNIEEIDDKYRGQLYLYKKALEESTGKEVKETWLYLIQYKKAIKLEF